MKREEIQALLDFAVKNTTGDSKKFFRSLDAQFRKSGRLSEKQIECLLRMRNGK